MSNTRVCCYCMVKILFKMNHKSQGESLCLIIDTNSNFLTQLGSNINQLLQAVRTTLGLVSLSNIHSSLTIYLIDTHDIYQIHPSKVHSNTKSFAYSDQFKDVLAAFKHVIATKPKDVTHQSKLTKCISKILCCFNKQTETQQRIAFITSMQFQFGVQQFTEFLQLVTHAGKVGIRFDLIQLKNEEPLPQSFESVRITEEPTATKSDALKIGVQLTQGILHIIDTKSKAGVMTALMLGLMNPGDKGNFSQPKIAEQQYRGFCACCNKLTGQVAKACSHCLAIHCESKNPEYCVSCRCKLSV